MLTGFVFSCTKPVEPVVEVSPVVKADLQIAAAGGTASIEMASAPVKATTKASWLEVSVEGAKVFATAGANDSIESRYATIEAEAEGQVVKFVVMQYGLRTSGFSAPDKVLKAAAAELEFPYDFDEKMVAVADASWVTLEITEDALKVKVAENEAEAVESNRQRVAKIQWSLGADKGVITVTQHGKNFMVQDSNWKVTYLGVQKYQGDDVEEVQNTVTDDSVSNPYGIYALKKSELGKTSLEDFVEMELASVMKAQYDEYIAYYGEAYGLDLTYSDFYYDGTDFEIFDIFEEGDYYGIAIGLDENCEPSGSYQFCEFTKTQGGGGDEPKGYSAWLGDWKVLHGTSTSQYDTWTISENVKDASYFISGIEGYTDLKIEAGYENGSLVLFAQQEVGTKTLSAGECSVGFYGATAAGNFWTPGAKPYTIATGTINADGTATLTPGVVNADGGETTVELAVYIATTPEGKYSLLKKFADATKVPATLTREGGNGGGDNGGGNQGGTGSAAFNKFVAAWEGVPADSSAESWVADFQQVEADKSIAVVGWQGWDDEWMSPMDVAFNSADGSVVFKGGTGTAAASNVQIGAPEDPMNIYYMASAVIDGQSYVITSGTGMYDACKGVVDASGKLVMTGLDVELSDGGTYTFSEFGVVAMDAAKTAIYTFKNELGELPYSLSKASGTSSVKSLYSKSNSLSVKNAVKVDPSHVLTVKEFNQTMKAIKAQSVPAKHRVFLSK